MRMIAWLGLGLLASVTLVEAGNERNVEELKQEIIRISLENISNEPEFPRVRVQLDALTEQLASLTSEVTEERIGRYSPGSWKQIWSDEADMSPPGAPPRDLNQIFQVVNPAGWGFNFGVRALPNGAKVTFALEVRASVKGNEQTTEITKAYSRMGEILEGESLRGLADGIFYNTNKDFVPRDAGRFPRGPIGATGVLTILFLDEDLKIGTAANVYSGKVELFVMKRGDGI